MRSLENQKKLDPIRKAYGDELFEKIEFREADLLDKDGLSKAIKGVQYIIHIANPVISTQKQSEEEMVKPATEGMWSILEAAVENRVKKIVVTSSIATIIGNVWKSERCEYSYSEQDYAPYESSDTYSKSKISQEAVIRYFIEMQEKNSATLDHKVEIVTLHPSAVFGPTFLNECGGSIEGIVKIMRRDVPGLPDMCLPCVDVRDVADAHIRALVTPGLHG